ncbi:LuxR C-terminal-related transcriptional regulator [Streptomyces olivochromogenes]|uniref:LuxR C-terminal-related transcriptional regulator n=1 Tax=Streptomyces olivochromogenes TaxID=1963 RepID=UPI0036DBB52D
MTAREKDVSHPTAAGSTNAEIAERPFLTEATAKTHATGPSVNVLARETRMGSSTGTNRARGGWPPDTTGPRPPTWASNMERVTRIELALSAWGAASLRGRLRH